MPALRTSRIYNRLPDTEFSKFLGGTSKGFKNNTQLPNPPVPPELLDQMKGVLDQCLIDASGGGTLATAKKNAQRAVCSDALDKNASYVDINSNDDLTILLSSGYQPVSTNRAPSILDAPQILSVDNTQTGKLKPRVKADANSRSFLGRIKEANGGEFGPVVSFKSTRAIIFDGLKAGVQYVFELCAVGGSTGQSDWSDPGTGMAQ
jgi:hypothetical protein